MNQQHAVSIIDLQYSRKINPITRVCRPDGSGKLRFPDFKAVSVWRWQSCHPYTPTIFSLKEIVLVLILLEAESTTGL